MRFGTTSRSTSTSTENPLVEIPLALPAQSGARS
jgi:hypothetical protein